MMYGNFQFSLKTLSANSLSRSTEFKWVDTDRVGDLPYVQNLGIAKDNVEIDGVLTFPQSLSIMVGSFSRILSEFAVFACKIRQTLREG